MPSNSEAAADYGMISPISLPSDGRMPDATTGVSSQAEYDRYFRLVRERPELAGWSRSCLQVQREVLDDLDRTGLSAEDRCDILAGCLLILQNTLEEWLAVQGVPALRKAAE